MLRTPDIIDRHGERWWVVKATHAQQCEWPLNNHSIQKEATLYISYYGTRRCEEHKPIARTLPTD